jgi:hypothetical protein
MDAGLFPTLKVMFSPLTSTAADWPLLPNPTRDSISGKNEYIKPTKINSKKMITLNFNIFAGMV